MIVLEKEVFDSCFVRWPEIFNQCNTLLAYILATYIIKCKKMVELVIYMWFMLVLPNISFFVTVYLASTIATISKACYSQNSPWEIKAASLFLQNRVAWLLQQSRVTCKHRTFVSCNYFLRTSLELNYFPTRRPQSNGNGLIFSARIFTYCLHFPSPLFLLPIPIWCKLFGVWLNDY